MEWFSELDRILFIAKLEHKYIQLKKATSQLIQISNLSNNKRV